MTREWPGVAKREWRAADVRRRDDTDYDVGAAVQANRIAAVATGALDIPATDAQYVVLAANSTLSAERVLTAGEGITLTDAGAGSTVTVATKDVWVTKAADQSKSSDTAYAADTALQFSVATGVYAITGRVLATSASATPDIKLQVSWPASSSLLGNYVSDAGTATVITEDTTSPAITTNFDIAANGITLIQFDLVLVAGASGTFAVEWAQNSSNGTATTVKAGSFLRYRKTV